jgi:hypothetical protein
MTASTYKGGHVETRDWWAKHAPLSGEELGNVLGINGGNARRLIRKAKQAYSDLAWFDPSAPRVTGIQRGIAVFDSHHPEHDKHLWRNILAFAKDFDPDIFALGGDNLNMTVLSHWVENKRRVLEGQRLKQDYTAYNRDIHRPLEAVLRPDCRRIWHMGNHEDWLGQYLDKHPEMVGLIEIEEHIDLSNWEVYQYGQTSQVGKLYITHGVYTNIHSAYRTAQVYGRNVIYGHGHSYQAHTITAPLDVDSHVATEIPCACNLNPSYRVNQPNAWLTGLAVFYLLPNGDFTLYPVIAVNGKFVAPTGKLYE